MNLSRFAPIRDFSELSLVIANAVPIAGVIFWDWSVFDTMLLYWLENVVIGVFNILKILTLPFIPKETSTPVPLNAKMAIVGVFSVGRIFLAAFFSFHYGMFMMVHGILVFAMFGNKDIHSQMGNMSPYKTIAGLFQQAWNIEGLAWPIMGIVASRLVSYIYNFWMMGERNRMTSQDLMKAPYNRMVVLHLTIIFGGWLVMMTGQAIWALVLLVIIKTVIDLVLYRRSHAGAPAVAGL